MIRVILITACLASIAFAGIPWEGEPRPEASWIEKHERFVNNTMINGANVTVLFYGDSITEGWGGNGRPTYEQYYAPLGTANYGIGGDRTEHLVWRINNGEVDGLSPTVCVLKIGTNNLGANTNEDIARGVQAVMDALKAKLPNMKILLLGILPRNNAANTARTDAINVIISEADNGNTTRFFDMRDTFYLGNGTFATELYTSDLLHLSAAGYVKWAEVMDPIFKQMLN